MQNPEQITGVTDTFTVVTWNILLDNRRASLAEGHPERVEPQVKRLESLADTLIASDLNLDVVAIQEAQSHLGAGLASMLGYKNGGWYYHNQLKRRNETIGMFGDRVMEKPEVWDMGDDKSAVVTRLGDVAIVGLHLRRQLWGNERTAQIEEVLSRVESYEKAVVLGDFNALPFEKVRRRMAQAGFKSVFQQLGREQPRTFPTPAYRNIMLTGWQQRLLPTVSVDDIYTRGLTVHDAGSFEGDSDHRGLWATLENVSLTK